jgi:hypothetical protein
MANLIITVIAIALVAVASLMGAYYGGSAFLNNQSAANASTVLNIGQQLAGAWTAYLTDNNGTAPTNFSQLIDGNYLATIPTIPAEAGNIPACSGPIIYTNSDHKVWMWVAVGQGVQNPPAGDPAATACLKIIKTATGNAPAVPPALPYGTTTFASSTIGNGTFGCAQYDVSQGNVGGPDTVVNGSGCGTPSYAYMAFYRLQ